MYICYVFTTGKIIFALVFFVVFIGVMIWAYRKDIAVSRIHFKHVYKILIALFLFFILQFLIVKMRSFF